jgi:acyl-CoA synthetase (AMP-forming)/AMP-acid ligase II
LTSERTLQSNADHTATSIGLPDKSLQRVLERLRHWAQMTPEAAALYDASCSINYAALERAIDEIAAHMRARGVGSGDRVLIVAENNIAAVATMFAVQTLDAWPAVVNARLPATEMAELRNLVAPRLVVFAVADSVASEQHAIDAGAILEDGLLAGPLAFAATNHETTPEVETSSPEQRVGLLIFTSGTTGRPKAVMLGHRGLTSLGAILARSRRVSATDCYNGVAPLAHIMGIANLMSIITVGASLRLMPRLDVPQLAAAIADGGISHLSFVPTVYSRLLDYIDAQNIDVSDHRMRYISCGGAPLDATLQSRVQSRFGIPLVNGYGMTECAPGTRTRGDRYSEPGSIGYPEEGVEARIVDPDGGDVAADEIGELWLRTPTAMLGYYRDPVATAAAVRLGGWIATGDLARRLDNGELAIVGRQKEMIIHSGFNVYPAEVEAALNSLPEVAVSGVVGLRQIDGDEQVVAFVELRPGCDGDAAAMSAALRQRIASYKCPNRIVFLERLPQGATGKIWKAELARMASELVIRS